MISVRPAVWSDNQHLIDLTRIAPMNGVLSLRIDRHPNFWRLHKLRGDGSVFVAVMRGQIVGCISVAFPVVYIDGKAQTVGYAADLKVDPAHTGSRAALALILAVTEECRARGVKTICCVVADGNGRALSALMSGRCGAPKFRSLGRFFVYQLFPTPRAPLHAGYNVQEVTRNELHEISRLCDDFNKAYQFAPRRTVDDFSVPAWWNGMQWPLRVLAAREGGKLRATLCTFDTSEFKQNTLVDAPKPLRWALTGLRWISRVLPYTVPKVGESVRLLYVRNLAFQQGHERALRSLLNYVRYAAYRQKYSFVTIGIHERDPMRLLVHGVIKYAVVSHGLVANSDGPEEGAPHETTGIPMEDFALV
ncbi:MAG TPA: GNAT family N-acetyltransferase [Gemmatimonadaceae bacterium]|nr:GNAT family N-acetyltransferase [Gemmatimonadaceae bacterium]